MFGAGTSPMMEGTGGIVKAPQRPPGAEYGLRRSSVSPCDATDVNGDASFRWEIGVRGVLDQWGEAGIYGGRWYYLVLLLSSGRGGPLLFSYIG